MPLALSPKASQADIVSNLNYLMAIVTSGRSATIGAWTITQSTGGNLIFSNINVTDPLMSLSPTGNLVIAGNVIHGTPS